MAKKDKNKKLSPSPMKARELNVEGYTQEEIELATRLVMQEREKQMSVLQKFSIVWSFITALYTIIATIAFIVSGWIESTLSYVLMAMLALYIIVFCVLLGLGSRKPEKARVSAKIYRRLLSIFKTFANLVFLVLTAVSMAGLAGGGVGSGTSMGEWLAFGATFLVAIVQLALKITKFILKATKHSLSRKYNVKVARFVNGEKQENRLSDKMTERRYK